MKSDKSFFSTYQNAMNGIVYAVRTQKNIKIQLGFSLAALFLGWFLQINSFEWLCIIFCIMLVLSAECFNTAIEVFCDFVHPEQNEKIKTIKDVSAGAVLILAIGAFVVGACIFLPEIYCLLFC